MTTSRQEQMPTFFGRGTYLQEKKSNRHSTSLDQDVVDKLFDESVRIRTLEGKKPSYSEVIRRIYDVYSKSGGAGIKAVAAQQQAPADPLTETHTSEERNLVAAFLLLLRDRSDLARGPREAICTLLEFWLKKLPGYQHNNGKKSA